MANLNQNPLQIISMARQNGPQQVVEQIIQQNYAQNPMMMSLLQMGRNNDINGIQQIASQVLGAQGIDVNSALSQLKSLMIGR